MSPFLTSVAPAPFVGSSWTRPLTWSGHHCSASQLSSCQSSDSLPFSPGPKYALYTKSIKHIHVGGDMYAAFKHLYKQTVIVRHLVKHYLLLLSNVIDILATPTFHVSPTLHFNL